MYDVIDTGPLYDKAVQLMSTYRSVAARMGNARKGTQGKLDRRLEKLGERIAEALSELPDQERMALDCWQDGIMPDTYQVDHAAITTKPYVSIRKIERWTEEHDVDEEKARRKRDKERAAQPTTEELARSKRLRAQLLSIDDDEY